MVRRIFVSLVLSAPLFAVGACDSAVDVRRRPGAGGAGGAGSEATTATTTQTTGSAGGMGGAGGEACEGGLGTECEPNRKGMLFGGNASASTVAIDSVGNLIIGGYFRALDLGEGVVTSVGEQDLFVAKLDGVTGAVLWSRTFGTAEPEHRIDLAVDGDDNVILSGTVSAKIDFGGGQVCDDGFGQVFLAKLESAGEHVFSRCFGGPTLSTGGPDVSVVATASGDIVMTGWSGDDVDLGSGVLPVWDGVIFVAKYGPDGQGLWSRKYGSTESQNAQPRGLAVDVDGSLALTINFSDAIHFGLHDFVSDDDGDGVVIKLAPDGELSWAVAVRGDFVHSDVAFGPDGDVVVGAQDIQAVVSEGGEVPVRGTVASFEADGALDWVAGFESQAGAADGVAVDLAGNVLAVSRQVNPRQPAGRDFAFGAFSPQGAPLFERHFGSGWARGIALRGEKLALSGKPGDDPGLDFGDGLLTPGERDHGFFVAWFEPWQSAAPAP
jgi:hypothetical protein